MWFFSNKTGGAESNNMDGGEDVPFDHKMVYQLFVPVDTVGAHRLILFRNLLMDNTSIEATFDKFHTCILIFLSTYIYIILHDIIIL